MSDQIIPIPVIEGHAQAAAEHDDRNSTITICPHDTAHDIARLWKDAYAARRMALSGEASA